MSKNLFFIICGLLLVSLSPFIYKKTLKILIRYRIPFVSSVSSKNIKIAAIGDSLTYGSTIFRRKKYSYPKCLETLLGPHFAVRNFGLPYYCVQKMSDFSYWSHPFFERSQSFDPDIVLLMLGTNDSKSYNWKSKEYFHADYLELVHHFQTSEPNPKIYLMTPPQIFLSEGKDKENFDTSKENLEFIVREIRQIASSLGLQIIDLNQLTTGRPDLYSRDCLHLNRKGAAYIAKIIYDSLGEEREKAQNK